EIDTLTAKHTGVLRIRDTDDLTVGSVSVTTSAGTYSNSGISAIGGTALLEGANTLTIDEDISTVNALALAIVDTVSQNAGDTITADVLELIGGTFTLAENNVVNALAADVTGNLTFTNNGSFAIGAVAPFGTDGVTAGGSIVLNATGSITVSDGYQ